MKYLVALYSEGFLKIENLPFNNENINLKPIDSGVLVLSHNKSRILSAGDIMNIEGGSLSILEKNCEVHDILNLKKIDEIRLGRSMKNDICLREAQVSSSHAILKRIGSQWFILDNQSTNGTFVNGKKIGNSAVKIEDNTSIFIGGFIFSIYGDTLKFENTVGNVIFSQKLLKFLVQETNGKSSKYPDFYRSPRLKASAKSAEVEILAPPSSGQKPNISWLTVLLPPSMLVIIMVAMSFFMNRASMMIYTLPMSFVGVLMAVLNYKSQTKKWREIQALIQKKYSEHLTEKENEIIAAENSYISLLCSASPGVRECLSIAKNLDRRLWERSPGDVDFMSIRLGRGITASNVSIKIPKEQLTIEENPYLKEASNLRDRHAILDGVPVCHSFLEFPVTGLVGERKDVLRTSYEIVMNIAVHHSYEDVKIVCVYPENEKDKWEWLRWLPHVWDKQRSRRFLLSSSENARERLRELAELLKVRRREISSRQRENITPEIPFYFLILADKKLVESSGEQFLPEDRSLGFAALYAYGDIRQLPGECNAIIECGQNGVIRQTANAFDINFVPDRLQQSWIEDFSRSLAPIRLHTIASSGIPMSISFLQGLGVHKVEELNILNGWKERKSYESLATPIGIKENGDVFNFDIHEKEMGPHGIVAGTTGSGKSEMLTAWLLSMAVHYSPEDVNFLLIEFKGNDLSNILKTLPHIAGVVNNLQDTSSINRSISSLRGEIARRQRIFENVSELETKAIFEYQKYQKKHRDLEPMPYLIAILDEFAQFKTQFPEQMEEFNSIARVGRSLGIYMVLTTQSPGGVITPQMDANSRFRVCLRTANTGESKEIIGTTDAFFISSPGRAYIKVADKIYEQVQTFYSKVRYNPDRDIKAVNTDINFVDINGRRFNPNIKGKNTAKNDDLFTEGKFVVNYIVDVAKRSNIPYARPVWTEPLPEILTLSDIQNSVAEKPGLSITVGIVDDPEGQRQYPFELDFMKDGHQILYGAPGSGKTTFLQTALLSAALRYKPSQIQFVIIDFGNWGLKIFERLPHTKLAANGSDDDKLKELEEYMLEILDERKRKFASTGVGTLEAYREVSGLEMPALLVIVDNMAALNNQSPELMDLLIRIAREGGGLGIYLLLTAGNPGSFMYRIAQYVKSSHALQLTDKGDYRQLVGSTGGREPAHFAGRGFTKGALEFQTALCVEGNTEGERVKKLREICDSMKEEWHEETINSESYTENDIKFEFNDMQGCIICGDTEELTDKAFSMIVKAAEDDLENILYVCEDKTTGDDIISELATTFDNRNDIDEVYQRIILCIKNFLSFYQAISDKSANSLDFIIRNGAERNMFVYISCSRNELATLSIFRASIRPFDTCMKKGSAFILGGRLKNYTALNELHNHDDMKISEEEGCIIHDGKVTRNIYSNM